METHVTSNQGVAAPVSPVRSQGSSPGDARSGEARLPRILRHLATGTASIALLYAAVQGLLVRAEPDPGLVRMETAELTNSLYVLAPWPLTALVLLWLAHLRPTVYARTAVALLLTSAAGLGYTSWTALGHLPADEGSLLREYLAMPGALTGWFLLIALAVVTAVPSARVRIVLALTATGAVAVSVLTSPQPVHAVTFAAGVPLLTWSVAGLLPGQRAWRHRPADAWYPHGRVISARPRTGSPARFRAAAPMPSRQAG